MIRIIHLSDLHIRSDSSRDENRQAKQLTTETIRRFSKGGKKKSIVVITGDLVDDGLLVQYRNLKRTVLKPLQEKFRVLAVPGNHDYAMYGNLLDKYAPARFDEYVQERPTYPEPRIDKVEIANERKILLVGVDSADALGQVFFADGIVDEDQRAAVVSVLKDAAYDGYFKILYVHHHPFLRDRFVAFKQAEEFLDSIRRKVDLVLFGHKHAHEGFIGRYGIPTMLASGKVTQPAADVLMFRVIELEPSGEPRVYTEEIPRS